MFTFCIAFVMFTGSSFNVLSHFIISGIEISLGADIFCSVISDRFGYTNSVSYLDEKRISEFLF